MPFLFGAIDMNIYPLEDVRVYTPKQNEDNNIRK